MVLVLKLLRMVSMLFLKSSSLEKCFQRKYIYFVFMTLTEVQYFVMSNLMSPFEYSF